MNVYDFDKTIYDGDSTLDFYKFCLKKQPQLIFILPIQLLAFIKYKLGFIEKLSFKEEFYSFLKYLKRRDEYLLSFWEENHTKIRSWYIDQSKETDLIISASPEFLLKPICGKLNVSLIASIVDFNTGKCLEENCYGLEKVNRYRKVYSDTPIHNFYSDSLSDAPLAEISNKAFIVSNDVISEWPQKSTKKRLLWSFEFFLFIVVGCINTFNGVIFSYLFSLIVNEVFGFIFGYSISLGISYILNSLFVFKKELNQKRMIKFVVSYIPNFVIQLISVLLFVNLFNMHKLVVYALAAIIGIPITFLILKLFAFDK